MQMPTIAVSASDPATIGLQAAANLFQFLCTPAGQKVVERIDAEVETFHKAVASMVEQLEQYFRNTVAAQFNGQVVNVASKS